MLGDSKSIPVLHQINISLIIAVVSAAMLFFSSCDSEDTITENENTYFDQVVVSPYEIQEHHYEELLNTMWSLAKPDENPNPTDSNGIEIFERNGETYYHALHLIQRLQWYTDSYYQTHDTFYMNWIMKYYDKLMELSTETDEFLYFNYQFDFDLHGFPEETMKAPWLSGMTQGVGLMVMTRLYNFTGNHMFLEDAKKVFNSFNMVEGKHETWITMIDPEGYLWIEEYPDALEPNYTLNGFIFCIYGLYEYYLLTKDDHAKFLLQASLTTVQNYIENFRVPGDVSYYCLTHKVPSPKYHLIHTKQLRSLYLFTGVQFFQDMADSFYVDYH